ncbi:MAG: hypothetical protein B6241_04915 [Spirochaetaceae bacterium 4572_59]|nr:MAG: hypothetical protein B6241_04915 [Spirochaetaceae bacterium 4572_59]
MDLLTETAQNVFGLTYLFPYQRLVITNILRKAGLFSPEEAEEAPPNQVVLLPTGAGKSLCFMLPAVLLPGLTIVIFPLLGLMADQLRRVEEAGMKGALLKGGMDRREKEKLWQSVQAGEVQMLLTNPEMLTLPEVQEKLKDVKISHLVIDEAHTIPEWGETFRPACLELGKTFNNLPVEQLTAFTATASPLILGKIQDYLLKDMPFNLVRANPDRVNIYYEVRPVLSRMKGLENVLLAAERPAIVFCPTRRQCERASLLLRERLAEPDSDEIRYYHAGLSPELRTIREKWFFDSPSGILCATCAYGLGMDKSNIRTVIHLALPASVEAYLQESGRAGRDRQPCRAVLLYHPEDRYREENNTRKELRERYEKLVAFAEDSKTCRRESLLTILEAEPEDCDSCDVCKNQVLLKDPAEDVICKIVREYRKRFNTRMLRDFLLGRHSPEIRQGRYYRSPGFGIFRNWDPDDMKEVIGGMILSGKIRERPRGSWKGKLH